jgi:hypothetical protein
VWRDPAWDHARYRTCFYVDQRYSVEYAHYIFGVAFLDSKLRMLQSGNKTFC